MPPNRYITLGHFDYYSLNLLKLCGLPYKIGCEGAIDYYWGELIPKLEKEFMIDFGHYIIGNNYIRTDSTLINEDKKNFKVLKTKQGLHWDMEKLWKDRIQELKTQNI